MRSDSTRLSPILMVMWAAMISMAAATHEGKCEHIFVYLYNDKGCTQLNNTMTADIRKAYAFNHSVGECQNTEYYERYYSTKFTCND